MKKAFHVITKILLIFILTLLFLSLLVFAVPRFFGITPDIVLSGSMEPSIPTGSICFVDRRADKYEVEVNDIISYKLSNDAIILHRVIAFDAKGNYITKGDANDNQDFAPVSPEQFVVTVSYTHLNTGSYPEMPRKEGEESGRHPEKIPELIRK